MADDETECPECESTDLTHDPSRAQISCENCGFLIKESMIDQGQEWRAFDSQQRENKARAGSPLKYTKPNKGLSTQIDQFNRDSRGNKMSRYNQNQMNSLRTWHKRISVSSSMERNLKTALRELRRISSTLKLPKEVSEETARLYRRCVREGLIRGRLIEEVLVSCLYIICRKRSIPRTLDELAECSGIDKTDIGRTYRFLKDELDLEVPLATPTRYVSRFAAELDMTGQVEEEAKRILDRAMEKGLISGRGPTGVAAAALYIAGVKLNQRRTQKKVAEAAGVTEVTIRNRYRELKEKMELGIES